MPIRDGGGGPEPAADAASSMLGRSLRLLGAFDSTTPWMTLAEICRVANMPKPTAHRLLQELVRLDAVERVGPRYAVGIRMFEIGSLHYGGRLREIAQPYLEDLYQVTKRTVHLAVLDGTDALYLHKIAGHGHISVPSRVGGRMPAYCTGVGKALLAFGDPELIDGVVAAGLGRQGPGTILDPVRLRAELRRIRLEGIAFDQEESGAGVACAAAPVLAFESVVAALSVTGPADSFDPRGVASAVQAVAFALSRAIAKAGSDALAWRLGPQAEPPSRRANGWRMGDRELCSAQ